jgi:hypothetical protein
MIELESMAVAMPEVAGHPNRVAFRGVLAVVDAPSQRAPSGARGHRVVLTRRAAEAALPSLLGMALDYAPSLDRHDVRRKVGVITRAEIVGRDLELGGYLFARDFPEIVEEIGRSGRRVADDFRQTSDRGPRNLDFGPRTTDGHPGKLVARRSWPDRSIPAFRKARAIGLRAWASDSRRRNVRTISASGANLGMSYEVTDVQLADMRARIWTLTHVTFTGAAILRRDKAAYPETWIELV